MIGHGAALSALLEAVSELGSHLVNRQHFSRCLHLLAVHSEFPPATDASDLSIFINLTILENAG